MIQEETSEVLNRETMVQDVVVRVMLPAEVAS